MSSWTSKHAIDNTLQLRDDFNVKCFIETGAFRGVGVELYSHHFDEVFTCDINKEYYELTKKRINDARIDNVTIVLDDSANFLKKVKEVYNENEDRPTVFFFLDAHFYNPNLPKDQMWVIIKELQALEGFENCIIAIHDFDCNNGTGHLIYEGQHCNWDLIKEYIRKINLNFHYYCNTQDSSLVFDENTIKTLPITIDKYVLDTVRYANSAEDKKHRGVLYATPKPIDLSKYSLVEFV